MRNAEIPCGNIGGSVGTLDFSNTGDATYRQTVVTLPFDENENARERERGETEMALSLREESVIGRPSRREGLSSGFR